MGAKTFPIATIGTFHLNATVAIFVIPFIFSINDVITEVYGKERARSVVRSGLIVIFLIFLVSILFTWLPASKRFMESESAYDAIFQKAGRISAASLIAFGISDFLDIYIFSKMREKFGKKALWFRNNASNFISEFIDSTTFMFLAFYALNRPFADNFTFLFGLIIPYWLLRCGLSVIETPFVYLGVKWLKDEKSE